MARRRRNRSRSRKQGRYLYEQGVFGQSGADGRVTSHPLEPGEVPSPPDKPLRLGTPPSPPPERARLAEHLYRHPHSPEGLFGIQALAATRRPNPGAPEGDVPPP